jgi:hypothetical protein
MFVLENCNGILFVYASLGSREKRLKPVRLAARKVAKHLKMSFEVKTFRKKFEPIYIYYKNGDEEPIPVCCVGNSQSDIEEICTKLRNMMFVLSFHPKHSALRQVRKEIMRLS